MQKRELKYLLNLALRTAKKSVKKMLKNVPQARKVRQDMRRDLKIEADKILEILILESLSKKTTYPVLSEESGLINKFDGQGDVQWIIDPLDGSVNFSRGIPICCVSISLWRGNTPQLGVVFDFNRHECFTAIVGQGAWLNGKPIQVSRVDKISKAVLCTGFPSGASFSPKSIKSFVGKVNKFKKVRLLGSAALSLAYVACGRADFYHENDIKLWDVAAGICLVKAAGGLVRYKKSGCKNALNVKAGNSYLL